MFFLKYEKFLTSCERLFQTWGAAIDKHWPPTAILQRGTISRSWSMMQHIWHCFSVELQNCYECSSIYWKWRHCYTVVPVNITDMISVSYGCLMCMYCLFLSGTRLVWRSWNFWSVWMMPTPRISFIVFVFIVISTTRTISVSSWSLSGILLMVVRSPILLYPAVVQYLCNLLPWLYV